MQEFCETTSILLVFVHLYLQGAWVWTDGSAWDYANWGINQPDDAYDGEDCLEIWGSNNWNDHGCKRAYPYICKI